MNFFVTGNSSIKDGLNSDLIAPVNAGVGNFAAKSQTLEDSYSIAQNIFRLVDKNKIDFVLIGLTADVLFRDESENLTADVFDGNLQALNDYITLCRDNGAQPIGIILPVAPGVRETYRENFLKPLADVLNEFDTLHKFRVIDFFDADLPADNFSDESHLNEEGAKKISVILTLKLFELKIFSQDDFYRLKYIYFHCLSYITDKNYFHGLLNQIYSHSLEKIRRKQKIRIAFVTDHAASWCGDKLYNLFAKNPRFETTVLFCQNKSESTVEDARHDIEQFKSSGINVVAAFDLNAETPPQDIIFFLRPYSVFFSKSIQCENLTPQTLIAYIPYGIETVTMDWYHNFPLFRVAWKHFFDTTFSKNLFEEKCEVGVPRGVVSGEPKMDVFFQKDADLKFDWKMTRPDAKKIIWAPHWSMNFGVFYSTFQYNYKFMYEFAKAHPETSWVVKPHPRLMLATVETGFFPSVAAYESYLQAWNDLPNAQVFTGAYYQDIFATSDGMIHDSCSFIAEYQYTHKPMIYLLNNGREEFTELGKKILVASYVIDGKNFEHIAAAIQKIFIEGNDPLKSARQKVFDEELNYYRKNGMDASDFIYKTVARELELNI